MESHYTRIYTGSMVIVQFLTLKLEEIGITPVIKEQNESGLDPKIYGGHLLQEIHVHNDELDKAVPVIQKTLAEMEA
ncbi:MAG: hypothetical protein DA407_05145 [Bacteroidetes bacterium]|nr:MAG: hypothetical protein DA407_05145 [Bacteroidota bacterium]